jgi:predicted alpha/beta superfamily hydrolase
MKTIICFFISTIVTAMYLTAQSSSPQVTAGRIQRVENFVSKYVKPRHIDIWLPEGYSKKTKYAVLYMHDGQMLFDASQTWNKQAWNVDDAASKLFANDGVKEFIVVGIWNSGETRHTDYFPQKPFEKLSQAERDTVVAQLQQAGRTKETFTPQSDNYLKFIVEELKPFIDKNYSVYTHSQNTFIAGSSMGGLISIYALCEYPAIFGGAACLSTHWPGSFTLSNNPMPGAFVNYLNNNLPRPAEHKIYFDCGDRTLDALYPEIQVKVDSVMLIKGYTKSNWMTKYFPGAEHTEKAWEERVHYPLRFLFSK